MNKLVWLSFALLLSACDQNEIYPQHTTVIHQSHKTKDSLLSVIDSLELRIEEQFELLQQKHIIYTIARDTTGFKAGKFY